MIFYAGLLGIVLIITWALMTTWTKRTAVSTTPVFRPKRRFFSTEDADFYVDTAGKGKGHAPIKQASNFYFLQANNGTTFMTTTATFFRQVDSI